MDFWVARSYVTVIVTWKFYYAEYRAYFRKVLTFLSFRFWWTDGRIDWQISDRCPSLMLWWHNNQATLEMRCLHGIAYVYAIPVCDTDIRTCKHCNMYCIHVYNTCMRYLETSTQNIYRHEYSCPVDHILREVFTHRKLLCLTPYHPISSHLTAIHHIIAGPT